MKSFVRDRDAGKVVTTVFTKNSRAQVSYCKPTNPLYTRKSVSEADICNRIARQLRSK